MTKFNLNDRFVISGLDLGMILYEINHVEQWMKECGVEDCEFAFSETRDSIERTLQRKVKE